MKDRELLVKIYQVMAAANSLPPADLAQLASIINSTPLLLESPGAEIEDSPLLFVPGNAHVRLFTSKHQRLLPVSIDKSYVLHRPSKIPGDTDTRLWIIEACEAMQDEVDEFPTEVRLVSGVGTFDVMMSEENFFCCVYPAAGRLLAEYGYLADQ